jgi:cytochrome b561
MAMGARNTRTGWGWVARWLHWATAALIALQFGIVLYILETDDLVRRFDAAQLHKSWGTVIFSVVLARVAWRIAGRTAPLQPPGMPPWQRRLARASHAALYLLLVVLPLSGWVYASASPLQTLMGIENEVFGIFALPDPWAAGDEGVARMAYGVHLGSALFLLCILALHIGAALRHHFVDRDDVLSRMVRGDPG